MPSHRISAWIQTCAITLILCTGPAAALAAGSDVPVGEVPTWLRAGAPVRLTPLRDDKRKPVLGEFREARGDSIWVLARYPRKDMALALADVGRFEVSSEQYPRTWTGAGIGFLAGAVLGVAAGAGEGKEQGDTEARIIVDTIVLGALGMAVGALVGHSIKSDRWDLLWGRNAEAPK